MTDTSEADAERIVSVTENGRVTIPESLRENHGISAPGRVKLTEEGGELIVRPVGAMREFRGLERTGDDERPATTILREVRRNETDGEDDRNDRVSEGEDE